MKMNASSECGLYSCVSISLNFLRGRQAISIILVSSDDKKKQRQNDNLFVFFVTRVTLSSLVLTESEQAW